MILFYFVLKVVWRSLEMLIFFVNKSITFYDRFLCTGSVKDLEPFGLVHETHFSCFETFKMFQFGLLSSKRFQYLKIAKRNKTRATLCSTTVTLYYYPSSRPGRPPKRGPVGLSLPASHMANHHPQLKKHRLDSDYPYENGHMTGEFKDAFNIKHFLNGIHADIFQQKTKEVFPRENIYLFF